MGGVDPYRPFQELEEELFGDPGSERSTGMEPDVSDARGGGEGGAVERRRGDERGGGAETIEELLDVLSTSPSRSERRRAFDELRSRGDQVEEAAVARLSRKDQPWYVLRNLLALLAALPTRPRGWTPSRYAHHSHAAVRREALKVLLRWPSRRDWSVSRLLEEEDPRSIALGLAAAQRHPPPDAIPLLIIMAEDTELSGELRRLAVRALGEAPRMMERDGRDTVLGCLLSLITEPPGWWDRLLKRPRLRRSPLLAEALAALHRGWSEDPRARHVLRRAAVDLDRKVRRAAAGRVPR